MDFENDKKQIIDLLLNASFHRTINMFFIALISEIPSSQEDLHKISNLLTSYDESKILGDLRAALFGGQAVATDLFMRVMEETAKQYNEAEHPGSFIKYEVIVKRH